MQPEMIPRALTEREQWVVWRYEIVPEKPKPAKVPYSPESGQRASVLDPRTWTGFEQARDVYGSGEQYNGLGFVLTRADPIVGLDIDHCFDRRGNLSRVAQEVVRLLDSYTEVSPSGRGLRIFAEADLGDFGGRRKGNIELYNHSRYLTVTGEHLPDTPRQIQPRLPALRESYRRYLRPARQRQSTPQPERPQQALQRTDAEVLEKMFAGKLGDLYRQIYHGDTSAVHGRGTQGGPDESRADVLLINGLVYWTNGDVAQVRRILLASPRAGQRFDKWHKPVQGETTYLEYQIQDSLAYTSRR